MFKVVVAVPCPVCKATKGLLIPGVSATAAVDYYRCYHCQHVWTTEKGSLVPAAQVTRTLDKASI
jgi:hypothetical protein